MKRRTFTQLSTSLIVGAPLASIQAKQSSKMSVKKPKRLQAGDTIGLITPGSSVSDAQYEKCIKNIERLGFKIKPGKHVRARYGYVAGTDEQRLEDLHTMFADDSVAGIWAVRGGYGCTRLLPSIDYKLIKKNPKVLIGYSDITALSNAIYQETGLIGFHGPVGASDFTAYTVKHLKQTLMEPKETQIISRFTGKDELAAYRPEVIVPGIAKGKLVGGNLSLLAAMAGTAYQLQVKNKLVFIEDIGEKPYRIDRMLTQLLQSSRLKQAAGIVLGVFEGCEPGSKGNSLSLAETLKDRLGGLGIPVIYGLSIGHISDMCTLPVGLEAQLDTGSGELTLLGSGVE